MAIALIWMGRNSPGALATTIVTTIGQKYTLDFYLSVNPGDNNGSKIDEFGHQRQYNALIHCPRALPLTGFRPRRRTMYSSRWFLPRLEVRQPFRFCEHGSGYSYSGMVLADVSVNPLTASVPESSFGALALGLGGLMVGIIAVRRRKIA